MRDSWPALILHQWFCWNENTSSSNSSNSSSSNNNNNAHCTSLPCWCSIHPCPCWWCPASQSFFLPRASSVLCSLRSLQFFSCRVGCGPLELACCKFFPLEAIKYMASLDPNFRKLVFLCGPFWHLINIPLHRCICLQTCLIRLIKYVDRISVGGPEVSSGCSSSHVYHVYNRPPAIPNPPYKYSLVHYDQRVELVCIHIWYMINSCRLHLADEQSRLKA